MFIATMKGGGWHWKLGKRGGGLSVNLQYVFYAIMIIEDKLRHSFSNLSIIFLCIPIFDTFPLLVLFLYCIIPFSYFFLVVSFLFFYFFLVIHLYFTCIPLSLNLSFTFFFSFLIYLVLIYRCKIFRHYRLFYLV